MESGMCNRIEYKLCCKKERGGPCILEAHFKPSFAPWPLNGGSQVKDCNPIHDFKICLGICLNLLLRTFV